MKEIIKLAIRNLREHKSKTIIISSFLIFGIAIVIAGNSFLEAINHGLENDFRANYTGDIVIAPENPKNSTIDIFGVNTIEISSGIPLLPALPEPQKVQEILNNCEEISKQTTLISAQVIVGEYKDGNEFDLSAIIEKDDLSFDDIPISLLFSGDFSTYWDTLSEVNFIEGSYPKPDTNEICIDTRVASAYERLFGNTLKVGDKVYLASMDTTVRDATVSGIFKPSNEYSAMFQVIYCNPDLARSFAKLTNNTIADSSFSDVIDFSLSDLSEDELFSLDEDDFFIEDTSSVLSSSSIDFDNILGDTTLRDELNKTYDDSWNFIITKVKNPYALYNTIIQLREEFKNAGIPVQVMDWKAAAYSYTGMLGAITIVFNILIIILAIVVFIIIMNTMIVSVYERTNEIGTMRAIGASRKFIKKLFKSETLILTSFSIVIGIIISFIAMGIINSLHIEITNSIAKMLLGGGLLSFNPTFKIIFVTIIMAIIGSLLSSLSPVKSALKITPIKALSSGE